MFEWCTVSGIIVGKSEVLAMPKQRFYETPDLMEMGIDMYVETRKAENKPITLSGAALFLGFCDYEAMMGYAGRDGYESAIKKIRAINRDQLESNCIAGGGSTAGNIFLLKANHGLQDKTVVEHKGVIVNMDGGWKDV